MCMFAIIVVSNETKTLRWHWLIAWIEAMKDELHQFDRLTQVRELSTIPIGKTVLQAKYDDVSEDIPLMLSMVSGRLGRLVQDCLRRLERLHIYDNYEVLMKIRKKARILELKRRNMKITVLTSYKPYPSRRYGVSVPALHKKPQRSKTYTSYPGASIRRIQANLLHVKIDDPNITIEKYIRLEEEKARRRGQVCNWETATYGKIWYDEDVHDHTSVKLNSQL
ncbi:hypothetical protein Tco_0540008 [Tanacetum coccineum]